MTRVLAVGAHPDDLEILCGGTLARLVAEGHEVTMAHATSGDRGGPAGTDPETLKRTRSAEARDAAAAAGARLALVGLPDGGVAAGDPDQRREMVALMREARPELVLTHHPEDYHGDHRQVSELVFWASFAATNPMIGPEDSLAPGGVPALFYFDTLAGLGPQPTEFVDITEHVETKRGMLAAHASQLAYLREQFGVDVMEQMEVQSRFRGLQAAVAHAEAFHPCPTWHRVRTSRLLP